MTEQILFDLSGSSPTVCLTPEAFSLLGTVLGHVGEGGWGEGCTSPHKGPAALVSKISLAHKEIKDKHFLEPPEPPIRTCLPQTGLCRM